jgi:hypothetical protein
MREHYRLWRSCLAASTIFIGLSEYSVGAAAQGVKNVVRDLYGGHGILLAATPPPFPNHAAHFMDESVFSDLSTALTANIGLFAFNSTSGGFTFDPERGIPLRTEESLGPLLAERASTLGRGKLNVGFSYSRIDFSRFNGTPLNKLSLILNHDDVNGDGILGPINSPFSFELDQIRVDLDLRIVQDLFAFYATYGVTPDLDVGVIFPVVHSEARAAAHATIIRISPISALVHNFDPSRPPDDVIDRDATGIGDVILRAKYNFMRDRKGWPDAAVVGQLTLPSGDEDNLLGTGETSGLVLLVLSKKVGWLTPHLNVGYEASTSSRLRNVRYVIGGDASVSDEISIAADVLGRSTPIPTVGGNTAYPQNVVEVPFTPSPPPQTRFSPLIDGAVTAKWAATDRIFLDAGIQVPLNRDVGLRPNLIWTVGGYISF